MKNKKHLLLVQIFIFLLMPSSAFASWTLLYKPNQRIIKSIAVNKNKIFIGSLDGVYVSLDRGKSWIDFDSHSIQKDLNGNALVNHLAIDESKNEVYASTSTGLYKSNVDNPRWLKIFDDLKLDFKNVNSVFFYDKSIALCTDDGFWNSSLSDKYNFERESSGLAVGLDTNSIRVFSGIKLGNQILISTSDGVYCYKDKKWIRNSKGINLLPEGYLQSGWFKSFKGDLYFSTSTGIYKKSGYGDVWENVSNGISAGLDGFIHANQIEVLNDILHVTTLSGVYSFDGGTWKDIGFGLKSFEGNKETYAIASLEGSFFVATREGLFTLENNDKDLIEPETYLLKGKVETDFSVLEEMEPTIVEVQKKALDFAGIPTNKDFKRYQLQSRLRNLLPRIDVGVDSGSSNLSYFQTTMQEDGKSNTDIYSYDNDRTSRHQNDKDKFTQAAISWNTGELLFDDSVEDIIGQARLTVNIRENLLDDITRIYFERRRLQLENILSPPPSVDQKLKSQILIAELTGQIDSRTGGWFSRDIEKRKIMHKKEK